MSASVAKHVAFLTSSVYDDAELHPAHAEDLARSGLTVDMIRAARLRSVPPADLARVVGPRLAARIDSALLIPYDETGSFYRCKLIRARAGVVQEDLALSLGVKSATISRWENGARTPRGALLERYLDVLDRLARESLS